MVFYVWFLLPQWPSGWSEPELPVRKSGRLIGSWRRRKKLTKTCSAVVGTRTSAQPPDGVSLVSGDVPKEFADRRLLRRRSAASSTERAQTSWSYADRYLPKDVGDGVQEPTLRLLGRFPAAHKQNQNRQPGAAMFVYDSPPGAPTHVSAGGCSLASRPKALMFRRSLHNNNNHNKSEIMKP